MCVRGRVLPSFAAQDGWGSGRTPFTRVPRDPRRPCVPLRVPSSCPRVVARRAGVHFNALGPRLAQAKTGHSTVRNGTAKTKPRVPKRRDQPRQTQNGESGTARPKTARLSGGAPSRRFGSGGADLAVWGCCGSYEYCQKFQVPDLRRRFRTAVRSEIARGEVRNRPPPTKTPRDSPPCTYGGATALALRARLNHARCARVKPV
jgi:hypothetical protein